MILVDTSIWIGHLKKSNPDLVRLLGDDHVLTHPFVIGELACGVIAQRKDFLDYIAFLPLGVDPQFDDVLFLVENAKLFGSGIGWVDANLLASAKLSNARLWTKDRSLEKAAKKLKISYF